MKKHTAGPWNITESSEHWGRINCTVTSEDGDVATVWQQGTTLNRANARLIAAAPDLLAELKRVREVIAAWNQAFIETATSPVSGLIEDPDDVLTAEADQDMLNSIDSVIAKAEGQQ